MIDQFSRTKLLYGQIEIESLKKYHIAVFGIGGVGGYATDSLARSGIFNFSLFDNDNVSITNCNRQIIANMNNVGKLKVDLMKERILSINPLAKVKCYNFFVNKENINEIDFSEFDYVIDAIDTITSKVLIIKKCNELNIPIISSMGAGNKLNPMGFIVTDIYKTEVDPLAKVMRNLLRKEGIKKLKVVFSKETITKPINTFNENEESSKREIPGSNAFVPAACGLLIGSTVLNDLIRKTKDDLF